MMRCASALDAMLLRGPCETCGVNERRERLATARLYLVCDCRPDDFLRAALRGGVDIVQLRIKHAADAEIVASARRFAAACAEHDALFILNDRPDLVQDAGADGVHVGQDDTPVARARELVGEERLIGLSTHSPAQIDAAAGADYIGVGPIHATPTKPGRPAVGLELVAYAAAHSEVPFFAIGGIDAGSAGLARDAGAERIAVVRALTTSADPESSARALRDAITRREHVGAT
jgi:thiamine-phosphate pyrophosphorylase